MTKRLQDIEKRLGVITPGPWKHDFGNQDVETVKGRIEIVVRGEDSNYVSNLEFIASAPTDLAWCISEIKRLRKIEAAARHLKDDIFPDYLRFMQQAPDEVPKSWQPLFEALAEKGEP